MSSGVGGNPSPLSPLPESDPANKSASSTGTPASQTGSKPKSVLQSLPKPGNVTVNFKAQSAAGKTSEIAPEKLDKESFNPHQNLDAKSLKKIGERRHSVSDTVAAPAAAVSASEDEAPPLSEAAAAAAPQSSTPAVAAKQEKTTGKMGTMLNKLRFGKSSTSAAAAAPSASLYSVGNSWLNKTEMAEGSTVVPNMMKAPLSMKLLASFDAVGYGNSKIEQNILFKIDRPFPLDEVVRSVCPADGIFQMETFLSVVADGPAKNPDHAVLFSDDTVEATQMEMALFDVARRGNFENVDSFADQVANRLLSFISQADGEGDKFNGIRGNGDTKKDFVSRLMPELKNIINNPKLSNNPETRKLLEKMNKNNAGRAANMQDVRAAAKKSGIDLTNLIEKLRSDGLIDAVAVFKSEAEDKAHTSAAGCGAVMRSAPVGVFMAEQVEAGNINLQQGLEATLKVALRTGAATHINPIAFVPAAYHAGMVFLMSADPDMTPAKAHGMLLEQLSKPELQTFMARNIKASNKTVDASGKTTAKVSSVAENPEKLARFKMLWGETIDQLRNGQELRKDIREASSSGDPNLAITGSMQPTGEGLYRFGMLFNRNYNAGSPLLSKNAEGLVHANKERQDISMNNSAAKGHWPGRFGDDATIMSHEAVWRTLEHNKAFSNESGGKSILEMTRTEIKSAFSKLSPEDREVLLTDLLRISAFHDGDSDSTAAVASTLLVPLFGEENLNGLLTGLVGGVSSGAIR